MEASSQPSIEDSMPPGPKTLSSSTISSSSSPNTTEASCDALNEKSIKTHKKPLLVLLRNSLKRTLRFFEGNGGIKFTEAFAFSQPRSKRMRFLLTHEFFVPGVSNEQQVLKSATSKKTSGGMFPPSTLAISDGSSLNTDKSLAVPLPSHVKPMSSSLHGDAAKRTDPLQHLVIRRPLRIPKAAQHAKWELMRVISGHQGWVRTLAVDPTNQWFASGGNDRLIKIWDLASGTLKLSLTGHINTVRSVQVSHRHPYLFSAGEDQMVKCWDLEYNKVIRHYHGHLSGIYCMALHPSLDVLATGGRDAVVRVWDMRTKLAVHVLSGHTGTVMSLVSQKAEPQFISGSLDKMIRCWDLISGRTSVVLTHHKKAIRSLAIHPREYVFSSAGADHVKVWRCPKADFERNLEPVGMILNSITIRDEGQSGIAIGGSDQGQIHFWDWDSGQKFQTIDTIPQPGSLTGEKAIYAVQLDMSETRLLTGECDKTIKVWREVQDIDR